MAFVAVVFFASAAGNRRASEVEGARNEKKIYCANRSICGFSYGFLVYFL